MKKLFLLIITLLTFWANAHAKELIIISDLDETLRMAAVENKVEAGIRLFGGIRPYKALQIIFNEIQQKNPEAKFYYLSNSFTFLYNGVHWTKKFGFPEGVVLQRTVKDKSDSFKLKKLKEIALGNPSAKQWVFFGDNVEKDPDFYSKFITDSGMTNSQVYIRDARLIFPIDQNITYFQHEVQILDDLGISEGNSRIIRSLPFHALVPNFLFKYLKRRLIEACNLDRQKCREEAEAEVREVHARLEAF